MGAQWSGPELELVRPPTRRRRSRARLPLVEAAPIWIVLAVLLWVAVVLVANYAWSLT